MSCCLWEIACLLVAAAGSAQEAGGEHPLSAEERAKAERVWGAQIEQLDKAIAADPEKVSLYSQRGDARFFLGRFDEAVADYEKMVELSPNIAASHWRRGIAYFYAGRFKDGAHQFEIYNTFDNVDRENGIWRYFCQFKAYGKEQARGGLLKYEKDDREPFPSVYKLFAGELQPEAILKQIDDAKVSDDEREKRLFYAHLYIGLNAALEGEAEVAVPHLREAVRNEWGRSAGYGPHYMWQVGRLHYNLLQQSARPAPPPLPE